MLDQSFTHKFFQRAARGALRILLYLIDFPEDVDGLGHMNPADRKKERLRRKKDKKKAEDKKLEEELAAAKEAGEDAEAVEKKKAAKAKDGEIDEEILLARDFTVEVGLWCEKLQSRLHLCSTETIAVVSEAYLRRGDYLPALAALRTGLQRDSSDAFLAHALVRAANKIKSPGKKSLGPSGPEIREAANALLLGNYATPSAEAAAAANASGGAAVSLDVEGYLARYAASAAQKQCLPMVISAVRSYVLLDSKATAAASKSAVAALLATPGLLQGRGATVENILELNKVRDNCFVVLFLEVSSSSPFCCISNYFYCRF
jgi:hypothetical protein